jgi:hypothetical protein
MLEIEERRAVRAAKKEANRQRWDTDPRNANIRHTEALAAIEADLSPAERIDALDRLRAIMLDQSVPLARRLRAGAAILRYEVPPGGAAGRDPDEITSSAYRFFAAVSTADVADEMRQVALENLVVIENLKAARHDPDAAAEARERIVAMVNAARRLELMQSGNWPPDPTVQWYLKLHDAFETPELPEFDFTPEQALSLLSEDEIKRRAAEQHHLLLQVRTGDETWRELLTQPK